ncbi:hypothetical protein H5410_033627 [Solanum commersonii]|uniref:Uncharacterized protein n=1 Tax=Solanum commersonii TaxID=4109 RepID=A0A9J5YP79_SOLCO|nr:hypothetical protein H5410_033627 [Solanum commersonii]
MTNFSGAFSITEASSPTEAGPARTGTGAGTAGRDDFIFRLSSSATACHGFWHDAALVLPSVLFVLYLGFHARSNIKKLSHRRSFVMIGYYGLLWFAVLLNLGWCFLQVWQCTPGKQVAWNLLSLFATSAILFLEISIVAFLLKENYASCLETLARTFMVSGLFVGVDLLLKVKISSSCFFLSFD